MKQARTASQRSGSSILAWVAWPAERLEVSRGGRAQGWNTQGRALDGTRLQRAQIKSITTNDKTIKDLEDDIDLESDNDDIKSITIIEIDKELIDQTSYLLLESDTKSKLLIINQNAFQYEDNKKYDTIYFDIWPLINKEAFKEMKILSERFSKNLKDGGWMDSWLSEEENY